MSGHSSNNPDKKLLHIEVDFVHKLEENRNKVFDDLTEVLHPPAVLINDSSLEAEDDADSLMNLGLDPDEEVTADGADNLMMMLALANPNVDLLEKAQNSLEMFTEDLIKARTMVALLLMNDQQEDSILDSQYGADPSPSQKLLQVNGVIEHFESWTREVFGSWIQQLVMREELKRGLISLQDPFSDLNNSFELLDKKMELEFKSVMSHLNLNYCTLISVLKDANEDIEEAQNENHPEFNLYV